jgi:DNA-binding transcriptional LysR family regulator
MSFEGKDLNLLIPLRALLEEANVTRAGERIDMGQSSMSSALARLRTVFDDELLVRVGRDYELTPLARILLPQVQRTLPLIDNALKSHKPFDPETSSRTYRILMSDYAAMELKPKLTKALRAAPNIRIDVLPLPTNPTDAERDMLNNDFIVFVPGTGLDLEGVQLWVDEYVCLLDGKNPAYKNGQLSWEDFMSLPQAMVKFGSAHVTPADRKLSEMGFHRKPHVTTKGFVPLPSVIQGTDLVAVVPKLLAERFMPGTSLVMVPAPFGHVPIIEKLLWHPSHDGDSSHVWLREQIIQG